MNEIIEKRGRYSKTFDLGSGKYRAQIGRHSHVNKGGVWVPTDTAVESEIGSDQDVKMDFVARSRFENLDYDIRFGKRNPLWMKIKHIPTGSMLVLKPKDAVDNPQHTVIGDTIRVLQPWAGLDISVSVTDNGTKTYYTVTSPAGQRVVEFKVLGDSKAFRISQPWYKLPGAMHPTFIPTTLVGGALSYDFRGVPVGTIIDPTITKTGGYESLVFVDSGALSWEEVISATAGSRRSVASEDWCGLVNAHECYRRAEIFNTSDIGPGQSITSASLSLHIPLVLSNSGEPKAKVFAGTFAPDAHLTGVDYDSFGTALSNEFAVSAGSLTVPLSNLSFISPTDPWATRIMIREYHDYAGVQPASGYTGFQMSGGDAAVQNRPMLTVDYVESGGGTPPVPGFKLSPAYPFARGKFWR